MKPIIIEMKDLSESAEIYEKKPNPAIVGFIYSLVGIIIIAAIWMACSEFDVVAETGGTISYIGDVAEVKCNYNAQVVKCNVTDGQYVREGTVLYELKVLGGDKTPKDEELVDGQLVIRAKSDGYFYTALEEGLDAVLQAESRVGYIFPKQEKTFQAEIYLVGKDIANVKVGQEVQIEIPAFPASEYGTITGHIRRIAQEAEFDPQSGTTYCGAWVELEATALTGGGNKTVPLRIGLFCQVKIITERKTVLSYIWESIR